MTFLNPGLWIWLAPLLVLPILIHFLNKRFPQFFAFSSVEFLKRTAAERSRLHRWRHRILALLRTLLLLFLLLAFLQPRLHRYGTVPEGPKIRRVLLLVDRSLSMEHRSGGISARQRAIAEAEKILNTLGPEDEVNVIAVGPAPAVCFPEFSRNLSEAHRFLRSLEAGNGKADFSAAGLAASQLLSKAKSGAQLHYISDFQRRTWAQVDFPAASTKAEFFFVDVGLPDPPNHGLIGVALGQSQVLAGDLVPIEVTVGNYAPTPLQETLTIRVDQRHQVQQPVSVAAWSTTRLTVPVPAGGPGLHLCDVSLPADALAADDRWVLTLQVLEKEEIVTVSAERDPAKPPLRFLHAALNPYPDQAGSLLPRHVSSDKLDATALAGAGKVFLTRCGPLTGDAAEALGKYLFRGGGVVWFLDDVADAANFAALERALGTTKLPLQLGPLRSTANVGAAAQQIATGDFQAPLLKLFRGPLRQDLGLLEIYDFHAASATSAGSILLRFGDETPAMASVTHGLGTLVLMNFSVSELSSNLARQRIFPAWIQELVKQLNVSEPVAPAFVAGSLVQGEVWREDLRRAGIASPTGRVLEPRQEPLGERALVTFPAEETGFYTLSDGKLKYAWAVNPDPEESDLRRVDLAQLPTRGDDARSSFLAGQGDYDELARGRPLAVWLLLAAVGALFLELGFQLWLRRLAV